MYDRVEVIAASFELDGGMIQAGPNGIEVAMEMVRARRRGCGATESEMLIHAETREISLTVNHIPHLAFLP